MSPLSRDPILELYKSIRGHITSSEPSSDDALEQVIEKFFINLFPVAYHHVVHSAQNNDDVSLKDFHADYKNCLTHTFNQLQPFGEIPSRISRSLVQSVGAANVLLRALQQGSYVLGSTDSLPLDILSTKCKHALVKLNYCASCKGHNFHHSKPCFGFCTNVMRGCLTQYIGGLDKDWSSFSEGVDRLTTLVRSKDGIEAIIKGLDGKLSEAIMFAMENGPDLEKKVKKACGAPSLATNDKLALDMNPTPVVKVEDAGSLQNKQYTPIQQTNKWPQPPDNQMILFINTLEKSKEFSLRIATSYCDDDRFQKDDKDCWTGDYLADYTHQIISMHSQKYNPEVPTPEITSSQPGSKVHLLNDKLINLRNMVLKPVTAHSSKLDSRDKMLSDMPEGSGNYYRNFDDDDDYGSGSGDGQGHGHEGTISRDTPYNVPKIIPGDGLTPVAGSGTSLRISIFNSLVSSIILSSCLVLSSNVILFRPH
jgi:dally-like protein